MIFFLIMITVTEQAINRIQSFNDLELELKKLYPLEDFKSVIELMDLPLNTKNNWIYFNYSSVRKELT